jgi:alpha,alpha-trehalose phosphorylase
MADALDPPEPWRLVEHAVDGEALGRLESLFSLGNGHLGLRGNYDEGEPRFLSGTYLSGFYESYPLEYGERGYGFAEDGQAVLGVADGKIIRLLVENEPVDVERGVVEDHERALDLRAGTLDRTMTWRSAYGHRIAVRSRRLVSFVQRSVAAIRYEVEALDAPLRIALQSDLVVNQRDREVRDDPRAGRRLASALEPRIAVCDGYRTVLAHTTRRTGLSVASGMDHVIEGPPERRETVDVEDDLGRVTISVRLEPGEKLVVTKLLAYHWSSRQTVEWLRDQVEGSLENALAEGWDGLALQQREFLDGWWARSDIEIDGDLEIQQALRFALFHLLQAGARSEGRAIAAKGLTGNGYDGHAFWDTETFVLSVLTYLEPRVSRDALAWRASTLPLARERAHELGLPGAILPWRTIRGEECSGYWPAGLGAMHVNADVADAVRRYVRATGDAEFEREHGLPLLVESARLWIGLGFHDRDGGFRISGVTGPDEYSALVDDNIYTNLMAQTNLREAADASERHPQEAEALEVDAQERACWRRAADAMYVPYDDEHDVHPPDAGFLHHAAWPWERMTPESYPLLLRHPYFELYRRQVIKQADLVLALWMRGDAFDARQKRRAFEHYEPLTVRDSSLSACAQSVVAAEVGHLPLAWEYLREAALMDTDDLHRNTHDGLHIASLAGAVLAVVAGLGGFRDHDDHWAFRPRLPPALTRLCFRLTIRGSLLRVTVLQDSARYVVEEGPALDITHWDEPLRVDHGGVTRPVPAAPELEPPRQPPGREPGVRSAEHGEVPRSDAAPRRPAP